MLGSSLPDDIFDALVENTKVINENTKIITDVKKADELNEIKELNIVQTQEIKTYLNNNEKTRYINIGKELFKPLVTSLDKLIKREKKRNERIIKKDKNTIQKVKKKEISKEKKENGGIKKWHVIVGLIAAATTAIIIFKDDIIGFFKKIWGYVEGFFGTIGNIFSMLFSPISFAWDTLKTLGSSILDFSKEAYDNVKNKISESIDSAWTFINTSYESVSNKISGFATESWNNAKSVFKDIDNSWNSVKTAAGDISTKIFNTIDDSWTFAKSSLSSIGDSISSSVDEIWGSTKSTVMNISDKISSGVDNVWFETKNILNSVTNKVSSSATNLWESGKNVFEDVSSKVSSSADNMWESAKSVFSSVSDKVTNGVAALKNGWDNFINSDNGLVKMGSKIIGFLTNLGKNAVDFLSNTVKDAILTPLKRLFGKAEEEADEASQEAKKEVRIKSNQEAADKAARDKLAAQGSNIAASKKSELAQNNVQSAKTNVEAEAKKYGLSVDESGKFSNENLKELAAKEGINAFIKVNNISDVDNAEYEQFKEEFKKSIIVEKGEVVIDTIDLQNRLKELGDKSSSWWRSESDFVDTMQNITSEQISEINTVINNTVSKALDLNSQVIAAEKIISEQFKDNIKNTIQNSENIIVSKISSGIEKAKTIPNSQIDKTPEYTIAPSSENNLGKMSDELTVLTESSVDNIKKQNRILDEIKLLLSKLPEQGNNIQAPLIANSSKENNKIVTSVSTTAKKLSADLWNSVSSWS